MSAQDLTAAELPRRVPAVHDLHLRVAGLAAGLVAAAMLIGGAFSGSSARLAGGIQIGGVEVGGLTPQAAKALLEAKSARLASVPITFLADGQRFSIRPDELGVSPDWATAVNAAENDGRGIAILQGFRRLELSFFGATVDAPVRSYDAAVDYELGLVAASVYRPVREARLARHGLDFTLLPGLPGLALDRNGAEKTILDALAGLSRTGPVALPMQVEEPVVSAQQLERLRARAERVVSAPVTLAVGARRLRLGRSELASMLSVKGGPGGSVGLGGHAADAFFAHLQATVDHAAQGARFAELGSRVLVVPARLGSSLDIPQAVGAVLSAAERTQGRVATLALHSIAPARTTADAEAMGITGLVSNFETVYGGVPNRIHNVELVAHLIDGKLIAPGATFSFNGATGARTAAKGFLTAPVIINGEVSSGLGGGVCQVSTTVFNAAFMAGLPITARTNHALYISHYPLGRDATVDYPDVDLRFVNDTGHWLLLRTAVGQSSLVVSLYGTPQHRRVVTDTAPLVTTGRMPIAPRLDRSLAPGVREIFSYGTPAQSTSVRRLVYAPGGKLLSDATWYSNYRAVPEIVLVGPRRHKPVAPKTALGPVSSLPAGGLAGRVLP